MARGDPAGELQRPGVLALGERLAARGDPDGAFAQLLRRDVQHERRVDAAGERDDAAPELAEDRAQPRFLRLDHRATPSCAYGCTVRATSASGSARSRAMRTKSSYSGCTRVRPSSVTRLTRTGPKGVSTRTISRGST